MKSATAEKNGTDVDAQAPPGIDTSIYTGLPAEPGRMNVPTQPRALPPEEPRVKSGMDVYEMDAVDVPTPAPGEIDAGVAQAALGSLQWQAIMSVSYQRALLEACAAKDVQIASLKEELAGLKRRIAQQAG